jgi:hypothetical protein
MFICSTLLLSMHVVLANAQNLVPPEVVQFQTVLIEGDAKTVTVGNDHHRYSLLCNAKAASCITPKKGKNYLLFNASTRWKMPGATNFITLAFIQDFTVKYNEGENIGLVSEDRDGDLGVFMLDKTDISPFDVAGSGYEQDTIFSDGPIIYGTGMSDTDRQKAWKHFFMQMVEAVVHQQGQDALGIKLAKRCLPGQDFCTMALDANLVGIGGIQEPRKVVLIVATDLHDPNQQLSRMVCTWPARGKQVCREWDTGKLVTDDNGQ